MRVDLDNPDGDIAALPRFQRAAHQSVILRRLTRVLAVIAAALLLPALLFDWIAPDSLWLPLVCNNLAALLALATTVQSARGVTLWRSAALNATGSAVAPPSGGETAPDDTKPSAEVSLGKVGNAAWAAGPFGRWLRDGLRRVDIGAVWLCGGSLLTLLIVRAGWNAVGAPQNPDQGAYVGVALLAVAVFALLVLERHLAACTAGEWPESATLAAMARLVMGVQLLGIPCLLFAGAAVPWPHYLALAAGLLPALAALELLARGLFTFFIPLRARQEPRMTAESLIAAQFCWPPRPFGLLHRELQQRFGIDLRQIWAFTFMRRAFLPIVAALALIGWLLTGVTQVPLDARGIYERFGKPVNVLAPGLNIGLPWPFGRVRMVENGVVHELATGSDGGGPGDEPAPAEGPAPESANRLWDAYHPSEKSQVIASVAGDRQSFQIVNMDVRIIYRIGLSDEAALDATYHTADVPGLIRSTANQVLVHDFASRTLDGVLGDQRAVLARDVGKVVQARLDQMRSGVEIMAIVIEAIHPPAGAANAYHGVQAAQIAAQALIARERGRAAEQLNAAQLAASLAADRATAAAHENLAQAQAADLRFAAERTAWRKAGQAFLTERYFTQLGTALDKTPLLVLDHRIAGGQPSTLDLRRFPEPLVDAPAPGTGH
ncbi:SPFH domain-containing protein [Martelella alba]|uniref:Protease modulator HflK n=1 Tax=Martelella alba TaxID=2590451 RepID=A0ABY2SP62_9HYPH|nr:SPFH domain-containing protein [Martelella alba]TKI07791.1 protease modulator HflK [Martelella alba]